MFYVYFSLALHEAAPLNLADVISIIVYLQCSEMECSVTKAMI